MSKTQEEIRIALFGPSSSGKTSLLASYYGNQQKTGFEERHGYHLTVEDTSAGNRLLSRYYKMEEGDFPLGTDTFEEYCFGFKVHELTDPSFKIVWYDYPGGWWENTPKDESEELARRETFRNLLQSHAGILLIDGEQYDKRGIAYVHYIFDQFKNEIRRIKDCLASEGKPIDAFPKQWVIAISKADILPDNITAEDICNKIVTDTRDQLDGLKKAVNSEDFGCQFMLISSAKGEGKKVINSHQYIGLQLIAPVVLLGILAECAQKIGRKQVYGPFAGIFRKLQGLMGSIDKVDNFLPKKYQLVSHLIKSMHIHEGLDKGEDFFRKKMTKAAQKGEKTDAAVAAMKLELISSAAQHAFYRKQSDDQDNANP